MNSSGFRFFSNLLLESRRSRERNFPKEEHIKMKELSYIIFSIICSTFAYGSSQLLTVREKVYYLGVNKTDHVTSRENCILRSGRLVHADDIRNATLFMKDLKLSAKQSYWLDGNGPTYLSSPSCLILSRTIITVGCHQLHSYICEIGTFPEHSISPTSSKGYAFSNTFAVTAAVHSSRDVSRLTTSFNYRPGTSATYVKWNTDSTELEFSSVSTSQQILSTSTISEPQIVDYMQSKIPKASLDQIPPGQNCQNLLPGSLSSSEMMCYRLCLSKSLSDVDNTILSTPTPHPDGINLLNDSLKVNAKETSKAIRKLTSAWDSRNSSKTIGAFAIAIISAVPLCVILMDLPILIKHSKTLRTKMKCLHKW